MDGSNREKEREIRRGIGREKRSEKGGRLKE